MTREQANFIAPILRARGFAGIFGPARKLERRSIIYCLTGEHRPFSKCGYHEARRVILEALPVTVDRCASVREVETIKAIESLAAGGAP